MEPCARQRSVRAGRSVARHHRRLAPRALAQLKNLVDRFEPSLVSDFLSWGAIDERHLNDVLPLPYTEAAIQVVCVNVVRAQEFLGRERLELPVVVQLRSRRVQPHRCVGEGCRSFESQIGFHAARDRPNPLLRDVDPDPPQG